MISIYKHIIVATGIVPRKPAKNLLKKIMNYANIYENMLERMNEGLPANWDGTYRATSK